MLHAPCSKTPFVPLLYYSAQTVRGIDAQMPHCSITTQHNTDRKRMPISYGESIPLPLSVVFFHYCSNVYFALLHATIVSNRLCFFLLNTECIVCVLNIIYVGQINWAKIWGFSSQFAIVWSMKTKLELGKSAKKVAFVPLCVFCFASLICIQSRIIVKHIFSARRIFSRIVLL